MSGDASEAALRSWIRAVLPVRSGGAVVELAEAPLERDAEGWIRIPLVAALLDGEGQIAEAAEGTVALVHGEDLGLEERTRAFLRGWARALESRLARDVDLRPADRSASDVLATAAPHPMVIDDLRLEAEEDFADALYRRRWLDSTPDIRLYPNLAARPEPVARDAEREAALAAAPDPDAMRAYLRWLDGQGDPRGALGLAMAGARRMDHRRSQWILRSHRDYFAGPFPLGEPDEAWQEVELVWAVGWIDAAFVRLTLDPAGPTPREVLSALLALPSSRFLRELLLEVVPEAAEDPDHHALPSWSATIERGTDALRRLALVRDPAVMTEPEDEATIRARFPRLERLDVV